MVLCQGLGLTYVRAIDQVCGSIVVLGNFRAKVSAYV